jgi:hypothetical protein
MLRYRTDWASILILASWIGYILLVSGPVASPKYRLPLEPPLMVLSGAGFVALREWLKVRPVQRS